MRAAGEIIAEVEQAAATGHLEIHLLGQIVNHYAAPDIPGCDFAALLERVSRGAWRRADPVRKPPSTACVPEDDCRDTRPA